MKTRDDGSVDAASEQAVLLKRQRANEIERLFSLVPILLCVSSTDGFFHRVNAEFTRVLGWTEDEMLSIPYAELVHPDDLAATLGAVDQQSEGVPARDFENRYRCKDGSYRWLRWQSNPVEVEGLMFAVARDVTEQRAAEAEVLLARDEATRANQAKNDFLSRMSHELRTPLNVILGFAQLLHMDELTDDQTESVEHITKAGHHLLSLINEVLDISRIDSRRLAISLESVAIRDVIEEVVQLMSPLAENAGVELPRLEYDPSVYVLADRQRLKQVLLNLVSNGIKYNRRGGSIWIRWETRESDNTTSIAVEDSGRGIPPEAMGRLFEAFDRLGAEQTGIEGTGLGLALSKALVEVMNGMLAAKSTLGEGSTFSVTLPSAPAPTVQLAAQASRLATSLMGNIAPRRRVLYIEDNLANLTLVRRILASRPHIELQSAMQGRLGLELAAQHVPDLIILDLHLPDLSGEEVLAAVRGYPALAHVPVIIASADATPGKVQRLLGAGAHAYLTKPLDVAEVLTVVDGLLLKVSPDGA